MSTHTQTLITQTQRDAAAAVSALATAAHTGAAAEAAADAWADALTAAEQTQQRTRRPRRLSVALAAGVVALALTGCGGPLAPVTDDAPLCDARTTELCFSAETGHYVGARSEHYGPGAIVHRGYLGLSRYVVPTQ